MGETSVRTEMVSFTCKIQYRGEKIGGRVVPGQLRLIDRVTPADCTTPTHWSPVAFFVDDTPFEWYLPVGIICVRVYKSPTL